MASVKKVLSHLFLFEQQYWWCCGILLLVSSSHLVKSSSQNQSDYEALYALKGQISGEVLTLWNDSTDYCSWQGVTCSSQHPGRVSALNLQNMKLQGTLSPYIGNLTFLRVLNLTANNFHGSVPQEISRLVHLQKLSLTNNHFTSKLPNNLTHCSGLEVIDLMSNEMSGEIFPELSSLSKLKLLRLTDNNFVGSIPSSLGNLSALTKLSLLGNLLNGDIPNDLCLIPNLSFFQVSANYLTGKVPFCFYNNSAMEMFAIANNRLEGSLPLNFGLTLPNIRGLYMGENNFHGHIPTSITNASSLEIIDLFNNNFSGSVPKNLGVLSNLTEICFNRNHLGTDGGNDLDFITSVANCSNLKKLEFKRNSLKGPLPQSISNLSMQLVSLNAWGNQIYGSIPLDIQNLINMQSIYLHENSLTGRIPVTIGMLRNLIELNLQGNQLSGQIPTSLGNLTQLTDLNLGDNSLSGTIPHTLENCQNLLLLNFSHNNLFGTIPIQVMIPSLTNGLFLQHNSFSGSLPFEVGNLTKISTLDVSKNKLSGRIPEPLGNCLTLVNLYMDGNFFQGNIPLSMNDLKGLVELDISHNLLSGEIPEYLQWFPLSKLNLSFNRFQGKVPSKGVFANASIVYVYGNGDLCGGEVQLQLPPCRVGATKSSFSTKVKIAIIMGTVFLVAGLLISFLVCYMRKVMKTKPRLTPIFSHRPKVSYVELVKATNGFSTENLIGSGSFGSVFKGILNEMDKIVAVKVLHLHCEGALKSFVTECKALRNLRHRNLCKLITICSSLDCRGNDFKALVFEYMPNGSLEDWLHPPEDQMGLASRKLNFIQRLNIAINVASAMEYLHHHFQPAIIHCDLKPSNVLLDKDLVAHVADFGLAKFFSSTAGNALNSEVSTLVIKGSIGYVAPEYVMASHVSIHGDVYSYGILLLEMFTRKRPTDNIFVDGLCLHNYAKTALRDHVMEIADPDLVSEVKAPDSMAEKNSKERLQESLFSVIRLGVVCSNERAGDRVTMNEVSNELHRIRDHHLVNSLVRATVS